MTKNKLTDLNDHLFAQIERISDEDLSAEEIEREVGRSEAVVKLADQITKNAALQLKAVDLVAKHGDRHMHNLPMIEGPTK